MMLDRAEKRSPLATRDRVSQSDISPFIVVACLQAAGAFETIGFFLIATAPATASLVSLVLWLCFYVYSLFILCRAYGIQWLRDMVRMRLLLVIVLAIACLSPLWSYDPSLSAQRVVHLLGTTAMGVFIGYHYEVNKVSASLFAALCILIIGGAFAAILAPDLGQSTYEAEFGTIGEPAWRGFQGGKNGYGLTASVLVVVALCRVQSLSWARSRWVCVVVVAIGLVALLMSKSMTSVMALMLALAVLAMEKLAGHLRIPPPAALFLALACVLLARVAATMFGFDPSADWFGFIGRSSDLTGRTDVWLPTWRVIIDNPLLGHGYGALWFPRLGLEGAQQGLLGLTWTAYSAHNGFLQLASEIGLPAAIFAVSFAVLSLVEMIRLYAFRPSPYVLLVIAFQVAFLVANVTEANLFVDRNFFWILFVSLPLAAACSYRRLSWVPGPLEGRSPASL